MRIRRSSFARAGCASLVACLFVTTASCGDDTGSAVGSGPATDAGEDALSCPPAMVDEWHTNWAPPRAFMPGACTPDQIASEAKCNTALSSFDLSACAAFERNIANVSCLKCLFSNVDDASHGPIVIHSDGRWFLNIEGCIALIDGDTTATGCGAKYAAEQDCRDAACANCSSASGFDACWRDAGRTVCKAFADEAICAQSPVFGPCRDYDGYEESFFALSALYCSTGFGAAPAEGGFADDAALDATFADSYVRVRSSP